MSEFDIKKATAYFFEVYGDATRRQLAREIEARTELVRRSLVVVAPPTKEIPE